MPVAALSSAVGAHRQGRAVGRQRDAVAEVVAGAGVGRLDVRLLAPRRAGAREHVDRAGLRGGIAGLVAVDAGRRAVLRVGAHRQGRAVGRQRDAAAEVVSRSPVLDALTYACWLHVVPVRVNT